MVSVLELRRRDFGWRWARRFWIIQSLSWGRHIIQTVSVLVFWWSWPIECRDYCSFGEAVRECFGSIEVHSICKSSQNDLELSPEWNLDTFVCPFACWLAWNCRNQRSGAPLDPLLAWTLAQDFSSAKRSLCSAKRLSFQHLRGCWTTCSTLTQAYRPKSISSPSGTRAISSRHSWTPPEDFVKQNLDKTSLH